MTTGRLAAKLRKLREEHEEAEMEGGELNLVPFLDIVTNVIMFLMMTTSFAAAMADINVSAPTVSPAPAPDQDQDQHQQDLNLTVSVSDKGFTVAASGATLYENNVPGQVPTIRRTGPVYPYESLTQLMRTIKDKFGDETKVILNADAAIPYETVVATMDAIRNDGKGQLFPDVLLSAGVN